MAHKHQGITLTQIVLLILAGIALFALLGRAGQPSSEVARVNEHMADALR